VEDETFALFLTKAILLSQFISSSAATPINIDTETANKVTRHVMENKTPYVFDVALEHIYMLMKKDSYKRFLSSKPFKEAMSQATHPVIRPV